MLIVGWRWGLWLRLGRPDTGETILGWPITETSPDQVTMAADSPLLTARNIVLVDDARISWVTIVAYKNLVGRVLWSLAAPVHQLSMPLLMRRASVRPPSPSDRSG